MSMIIIIDNAMDVQINISPSPRLQVVLAKLFSIILI